MPDQVRHDKLESDPDFPDKLESDPDFRFPPISPEIVIPDIDPGSSATLAMDRHGHSELAQHCHCVPGSCPA